MCENVVFCSKLMEDINGKIQYFGLENFRGIAKKRLLGSTTANALRVISLAMMNPEDLIKIEDLSMGDESQSKQSKENFQFLVMDKIASLGLKHFIQFGDHLIYGIWQRHELQPPQPQDGRFQMNEQESLMVSLLDMFNAGDVDHDLLEAATAAGIDTGHVIDLLIDVEASCGSK